MLRISDATKVSLALTKLLKSKCIKHRLVCFLTHIGGYLLSLSSHLLQIPFLILKFEIYLTNLWQLQNNVFYLKGKQKVIGKRLEHVVTQLFLWVQYFLYLQTIFLFVYCLSSFIVSNLLKLLEVLFLQYSISLQVESFGRSGRQLKLLTFTYSVLFPNCLA